MIVMDDCLTGLRAMEDNSVDLIFGSPPYENCRDYGIGFKLSGQDWVDWMVERVVEMVRVCKGVVGMVVEGKTRQFKWSATPALLMADLHRRGITLRKPPIFHRVGIPGSGGPDWWRNDWEAIICCTSGGKLPWSDNTAMGAECKWPVGGAMSNRTRTGSRVGRMRESAVEPKAIAYLNGEMPPGSKLHTKSNGVSKRVQCYTPPVRANPGNVIRCDVGGGRMGSPLAHDNEAAFPEKLVEWFVLSYCPPNGLVLDPFAGSGTTLKVALKHGRRAMGFDIRQSQVELTEKRMLEVNPGTNGV